MEVVVQGRDLGRRWKRDIDSKNGDFWPLFGLDTLPGEPRPSKYGAWIVGVCKFLPKGKPIPLLHQDHIIQTP